MRLLLIAPLALLVALAGCAHAEREPGVRVHPETSRADEPVRIEVSGLAPREVAALRLRSTDDGGVPWHSSVVFRADAGGRIDVRRARPLSGDYAGVAATGLIWSMRPSSTTAFSYRWPEAATKPMTFTLVVHVRGRSVASTTFERRLAATELVWRRLPRRLHGFFVSRAGDRRRPAVLLVGGSEGGAPSGLLAAMLAARGHPALGLAYWREPGLPPALANVPLEYFARALNWLRRQPQVDPRRIVTLGSSRGSEVALLLGVHYPSLVHGVVAAVPNSVSLCSYPACDGPAWTLRGRALPYTSQFDVRRPTDDPRALIPVERIQGPILVVCGGLDRIWNSCGHAKAIVHRVRSRRHRYRHVSHAYPDAGHGVGALVPYVPSVRADVRYEADQRARADLWPRLLDFLAQVRPT